MSELLSAIPSGRGEGQSLLDDIHVLEANRLATKGSDRTHFLECENGSMHRIPVESLNLGYRHRVNLACFLLRKERSLAKRQIRDLFPNDFFETAFWAVWSAQ
jgi:oleate hydratase